MELRLKKDKCLSQASSLEYLGFRLDKDGTHKTNGKVRAAKAAQVPSYKKLQSSMGIVTIYG